MVQLMVVVGMVQLLVVVGMVQLMVMVGMVQVMMVVVEMGSSLIQQVVLWVVE